MLDKILQLNRFSACLYQFSAHTENAVPYAYGRVFDSKRKYNAFSSAVHNSSSCYKKAICFGGSFTSYEVEIPQALGMVMMLYGSNLDKRRRLTDAVVFSRGA